jgi:hypothetical protein
MQVFNARFKFDFCAGTHTAALSVEMRVNSSMPLTIKGLLAKRWLNSEGGSLCV